jgi:hypothetical protein
MTKKEKIEAIKEILYFYEGSLSDGYQWYGQEYGLSQETKDEVDELLTTISEEILKKIESNKEKEHWIQDWRTS